MKLSQTRTVNARLTRAITLGLIVAFTLAACGGQKTAVAPASPAPATDLPQPSDTPAPTRTPEPTSTATPFPTDTPTMTPTATPTPDLDATEDAEVAQQAAELAAAIAPELEKLGLSVQDGYLAWYSTEPVDIKVFDYGTYDVFPIGDDLTARDFVLFTDVSWESTYGFAICGIVYRAEPGVTSGEYYIFQSLRMSGLPAWDISYLEGNQYVTSVSGGVQVNRAINLDQGSTNSYMLVVQGEKMTAYANGTRLRTQYDTHRDEGILAFVAGQESGQTTCTFSNGWVWVMK